jgi:hypothetical protein
MFDYKMPTKKSYVGNDMGSRIARRILDTSNNYSQMDSNFSKSNKTGVKAGRNNARGAKGAR